MFHHSSILFICTPLWAWQKDQEVLPSRFHLKQNLQWTNMAWCIWYYLIQLIPPVSWHQHVSPWRAAGPGRGHGVHRGNRPGWKQHGGVNSCIEGFGSFLCWFDPRHYWFNMDQYGNSSRLFVSKIFRSVQQRTCLGALPVQSTNVLSMF